jgi:xanthine/uracil permease
LIASPAGALLNTRSLKLATRQIRFNGTAIITVLLVALVLLLNVLAACPALHELIHHDAAAPEHECAVTLFAHGQMDAASVVVAAVAPVIFVETTPQIVFSVSASTVENLPAGRAPPVSVSSPV